VERMAKDIFTQQTENGPLQILVVLAGGSRGIVRAGGLPQATALQRREESERLGHPRCPPLRMNAGEHDSLERKDGGIHWESRDHVAMNYGP